MNRFLLILSISLFLVTGTWQNSFAQNDDVYYDPAKDKGIQNNSQQPNKSNNADARQTYPQAESTDKTDGYSSDNPAFKYDPRDNYSPNTTDYYESDVSYDDDYDSYYYTTNLHRYYRLNYGVSYYDYSFTPSYYYGYSNWNTRVVVSVSPWYNDTWWRWNRHHHTTIYVYDPYYDPYYDWNMGWNSAYYTYSWGNPYWGNYSCNYGWGYNSWAYNWGNGCGYGGYYNPYYYGYNCGYNNDYNNGYNNGYNCGYHDGYNTASGYNPYYHGHHQHKDMDAPSNIGNNKVSFNKENQTKSNGSALVTGKTPVASHPMDIPREGIQQPINQNTRVVTLREGVSVNANTVSPYNEKQPEVVVKPSQPITQAPNNGWQEKPIQSRDNHINAVPKQESKPWTQQTNQQPMERTLPKENNGWNSTPSKNWNNQPVQRNNSMNERPRETNVENRAPQQQPKENRWNEQPRVTEQPRTYQQQRPVEQPRQNEQRREVPQQRPMEQRAQPRNELPHGNFQSAPQKNTVPSNNGGSLKRH